MPRQSKPVRQEPGKPRKSDAPPPPEKPERRRRRFKPDTLALRAVKRAQKETCQYIPFAVFNRLVHELLAQTGSKAKRWQEKAVKALWTESEAMLVDVFMAANVVRDTCKRKKLTDKHIRSALCSADIVNRTDYFRRVWGRPEGAPPPHLAPEPDADAVSEAEEEESEEIVVTLPATPPPVVAMEPAGRLSQTAKPRSLLEIARAEQSRNDVVAQLKLQHMERMEREKQASQERQRSLQPMIKDVTRMLKSVAHK